MFRIRELQRREKTNPDPRRFLHQNPPFNSNKDYAAPVGSKAAGAAFKDTWTLSDVDIA